MPLRVVCLLLVWPKSAGAFNRSGGFHHATTTSGGGFCVYPDITMMVEYVRTRMGKRNIMIVYLDAHQGNGHERDHLGDDLTYIVDFYNHNLYPQDFVGIKAIRLTARMKDEDLIRQVESIEKDIDQWGP